MFKSLFFQQILLETDYQQGIYSTKMVIKLEELVK